MVRKSKLPDCTKLHELYVTFNLSELAIAEMYGVTRQGVSWKLINKCHMQPRDKSAARLVAIEEGRVVYEGEDENE